MSGFVLHPDAFLDLDDIWEFIAADNLNAADRVLEEIHETIRALVPFPQQVIPVPILLRGPCAFILCVIF